MDCLICNSKSEYYFSKTYKEEPFKSMMNEIGSVDYYQCSNCGFTLSKTHRDLDSDKWEKLNYDFHHFLENKDGDVSINQPPYIQQALMIKVLVDNEIINFDNSLDYAGGYGTLSNILHKYFDLNLSVYDPYVESNDRDIYISKNDLSKYDTVLNSALFEHLTTRESFDEINNCVSDNGCMIIHTRISGFIPKDPNWFYLNPPVHCAFHTNKSMEILMEQWNYQASIYCISARCWILLKNHSDELRHKVEMVNKEFQTEFFNYKKGFVDFWKEY